MTMRNLRQVYMIPYDIHMISLPFLQFVCKMQQIVQGLIKKARKYLEDK